MSDHELPPARRRRRLRLAPALIVLTAVGCVAALFFRTPLCARYWAWRLAGTPAADESAAYLNALCSAGAAGHWGVRALLADERPTVRQYGVIALHHLNTSWARERLLDCLADPDPRVQDFAALGLAVRGDPAVIPTLKWHFETGDAESAANACRAFEHLATPEAVAALYELAVQPADAERRVALVATLSGIGSAACVPALLELLADERVAKSPAHDDSPPADLIRWLHATHPTLALTTSPTSAPASTVGAHAAAALARITAIAAPPPGASAENRAAVRQLWAEWWAARAESGPANP